MYVIDVHAYNSRERVILTPSHITIGKIEFFLVQMESVCHRCNTITRERERSMAKTRFLEG